MAYEEGLFIYCPDLYSFRHPSSDQGCYNQCWPQTDSVTVAEILALGWCGAGGKYIDYSVSVGCFSSHHFEST